MSWRERFLNSRQETTKETLGRAFDFAQAQVRALLEKVSREPRYRRTLLPDVHSRGESSAG